MYLGVLDNDKDVLMRVIWCIMI